jgi:aristolochene synthase
MNIHLSKEDLDSVTNIERNCGRHISIVNDIYSFEKELITSRNAHKEGGFLCNSVKILASEASLSIPVSKQILWLMCREWEVTHKELAEARLTDIKGCTNELKGYLQGLEYHMSGNELWSKSTQRYSDVTA